MGEVIIWDFETKGIARASQPHDQAVASLAWTRDGRHVVSAAADRTVSMLSILDNKQVTPAQCTPVARLPCATVKRVATRRHAEWAAPPGLDPTEVTMGSSDRAWQSSEG